MPTRTHENRDANVTFMRFVEEVAGPVITQAEYARAVGASERSVQNWTTGATKPRGGTVNRVLDLAHLVKELSEVYTDEGIQIWLKSRNRNLGGARPIELLSQDRFDEVLAEAERVVGGM